MHHNPAALAHTTHCGNVDAFLLILNPDKLVPLVLQTIKPDLSNFDGDMMSAWPYLIDEFVEHLQKQRQAPQS